MKLCLVIPFAVLLAGCPAPKPAPGPVEFNGGTCLDACHNLGELKGADGKLGCEDYRPTPKGAVCIEFCANAFANGARWNLKCLEKAETCSAATACPSVE